MPSGRGGGAQVPKPADALVTVREVAAGPVSPSCATAGGATQEQEADSGAPAKIVDGGGAVESEAAARVWLDPPWTPAFLRRNEVMFGPGSRDPVKSPPFAEASGANP